MAGVAGALSEQIQSDFAPVWKVRASVGVYPSAPAGTWAVHIQKKLDQPSALGYHTDNHNQPVAYVEAMSDTSVTISHEVLEMLADPWGNRMHSARLPQSLELSYKDFPGLKSQKSHVHYLLEVCDPCEATSAIVGGYHLSDFLLPHWYRSTPTPAPSYSYAGGCELPREVADGGYVSFAVGNDWYQAFNEGGRLQVQSLGQFSRADHASLREFADYHAREFRARAR